MLYLIPWREEWAKWVEFRCFCYRRRITAFSQYAWPRDVGLRYHANKQTNTHT